MRPRAHHDLADQVTVPSPRLARPAVAPWRVKRLLGGVHHRRQDQYPAASTARRTSDVNTPSPSASQPRHRAVYAPSRRGDRRDDGVAVPVQHAQRAARGVHGQPPHAADRHIAQQDHGGSAYRAPAAFGDVRHGQGGAGRASEGYAPSPRLPSGGCRRRPQNAVALAPRPRAARSSPSTGAPRLVAPARR
jgi:hypothetical protein